MPLLARLPGLPSRSLVLALLASGCVREIGRGPDVGPCAEYPDGTYTYGEIGIGRCLSGPADIAFVEQGGRTWLAVTNSDPYRNFTNGSVLLIDWASVDLGIGRNPIDTLETAAIATQPFVGGIGWIPDRELLLVPERFSEGTKTQSTDDGLLVFDLADAAAPVAWSEGERLTVGADPQPIVVDAAQDRAYVANLTDHTITVLDTQETPIATVDVAPDASIGEAVFEDDLSDLGEPLGGSVAELAATTVIDAEDVPTEEWRLTWIDGTFRLWVPSPSEEADVGSGLYRTSTGGQGYVPSGLGLELDPGSSSGVATEIREPWLGFFQGFATMYFSDDGVVRSVLLDPATGFWDWSSADTVLRGDSDWNAWIGGTAILTVAEEATAFYEARSARDEAPVIGVATSTDGLTWDFAAEPIVTAPEGFQGVAQPFVRNDPVSGSLRMWTSLWDGDSWSIGLTESRDDGATWTAMEVVLSEEGADVAAPAVAWSSGRYLMWFARGDGSAWTHATAWSWDGRTWYDVRDAFASEEAYDPQHPPRLALQADSTSGWRIAGRDEGRVPEELFAGTELALADEGFSLRSASGHDLSGTIAGDAGANGIETGSYATVDSVDTLYVTLTDENLRTSLAALQWNGAEWELVAEDLVPEGEGGNSSGAQAPVVVGADGAWTMYYAAGDADGAFTIRRATSSDGLSWTPEGGALVDSADAWDDVAQLPHSVEDLGDGRVRLWYGGYNGSRWRIGSAIGDGESFEAETGAGDQPWQLGEGDANEFDDDGVAWPWVVTDGDVTHLFYAGYDGAEWHLGHAVREGDAWVRNADPITEVAEPVLNGLDLTFSAGGVYAPIALPAAGGGWTVWYTGTDGVEPRVGGAIGRDDALFAAQRFPTAGDELVFGTRAGSEDTSVIQLEQTVDGFVTSGEGVSNLIFDEERGFLYVPSKKTNYVYVVDVRDDSTGSYVDANYLDIEAIFVVTTTEGPRGFRDVEPIPGTSSLYLTSWGPDALFVVDATDIVDDDRKQAYVLRTVAALPMIGGGEDEGVASFAGAGDAPQISGGDMALAPDGRTLLVPHFQDNSLEVFDLGIGAFGQEIRRIPYLGENPHVVRFSPDGRHAVVANYTGEVRGGAVSSTLVVIDTDPTSPTYLEPLTWIANR
jgi:DNA-binding beta-propeller fold protein YncE